MTSSECSVSFVPQAAALDRHVSAVMLRVLTFLGGEGRSLGYWSRHTPESIAEALGVSARMAATALRSLVALSYIEQGENVLLHDGGSVYYRVCLTKAPVFSTDTPISSSRLGSPSAERLAVPV